MEALKSDQIYTYKDYVTWDDGNRYELIDGAVYMMPTPLRIHQSILGKLLIQIAVFLTGKPCEIYPAPFDVRLHGMGDADTNVVQPDIVVVCDRSKLDDKGCNGAPDMVVEILSPSNSKHDTVLKFNKYLQAGVREYWIIDPTQQSLLVHILDNGKYTTYAYEETAEVYVSVLEGCKINLKDVFDYYLSS